MSTQGEGKVDVVGNVPPSFIQTEATRALDTEMHPDRFNIHRYAIPGALGHSEYEDVAARILYMSREQGGFVAPSWRTLAGQVVDELKEMAGRTEARRAALESEWKEKNPSAEKDVQGGVRDRIVAFFARLFGKKANAVPVADSVPNEESPDARVESAVKVEEEPLPFSVLVTNLYMGGSLQGLANEVRGMEAKGYLKVVNVDGENYLEPTEKLMKELRAKVGVAQIRIEG